MHCRNCGSKLDDDALFCMNCGVKLSETLTSKYCFQCGNKLDEDAVFCTKCGRRLEEKASKELKTEISDEFTEGFINIEKNGKEYCCRESDPDNLLCRKCHASVSEESTLCWNCNNNLVGQKPIHKSSSPKEKPLDSVARAKFKKNTDDFNFFQECFQHNMRGF